MRNELDTNVKYLTSGVKPRQQSINVILFLLQVIKIRMNFEILLHLSHVAHR